MSLDSYDSRKRLRYNLLQLNYANSSFSLVLSGYLVYKLRRVKSETNFISSGSKIVKRLRRRQYDPVIIEKTIGIVIGHFTALYSSFLERCTLTDKAVGTI